MAAITNRAIVAKRGDGGELELELTSKPVPDPSPGRVIVRILLRPINPTDLVSIRTGRFGHPVSTPGSEGYGIVHAVGDGVTKVKVGQRVVPFMWEGLKQTGDGSWQDYVSVREEMLSLVPDSIPDEVAAQFVINPWTAIGMLRDLATPRGEYILQTAAGSVLGRQIIQLAKHLGIKTINVVRREEQKEELRQLGADEVICSTTEDVVARVKEITDKKLVHGALDCVGGELTKSVAASVRRGGTVFVYGVLSSMEASIRIHDLLRQVRVTGWILVNHWEIEQERNAFISEAWKLLESKVIQPFSGKRFPLSEFKAAMEASETMARGGKVFLES
ncbi:hypothetical protein SELMODRAFT_268645 [Selaginella moellendorffii]|uniref:Enoyl reductase (ER) domain-containing protein n=1 Tax=Selaginella moellendorffii TaxID=88036 RepID=D8SHQ7_SELML|nr:enoyl-[acyl-carrier-protein] reductase, mitochondrial [Selaginella moellendorffii]EFJ16159.1 hypothetical protein SELMODRAFT_268645 [Selaginella moellendorffii]|eukprot:XP_002982914.1 enoyl-[acyl-carrier-protein] reductase, mitochondrial [Selaginella moellendorffii]